MKTLLKNTLTVALLLLTVFSCSVSNKGATDGAKNAGNLEKFYAELIHDTEAAFELKTYQLALSKYQDAFLLKIEDYPKDQILKIKHITNDEPQRQY